MKRRHLLFIFVLSLVLFLVTGCGEKVAMDLKDREESTNDSTNEPSQRETETDTIIIYDNNGKELIKTNEQAKIDYFSDLIGRSVEYMEEDEKNPLYESVPEDAVISYKYTMIHRKEDGEEDKVDFYVYENYPYITLKGIPFLSPLTWGLSPEDHTLLQNPQGEE